jgi:transposase
VAGWRVYRTAEEGRLLWVEKTLGWSAEIVRHPPKPAPEEVMMRCIREFNKEGMDFDTKKFMPHKGQRPFLPKRWVVERTFSWLSQNRRMSLWTTNVYRRAQKPSSTRR